MPLSWVSFDREGEVYLTLGKKRWILLAPYFYWLQEEQQPGLIWPGIVFLSVLPLSSLSLSPSLSKHLSLTLLFAKIQVTMATNWRLYEHLIPHLNIPSYLW